MVAPIVIGLGWGDEGKGLTTDWLCQGDVQTVVRFNGGQQAAHTVVYDGKRHVFASYGSGTLRGKETYLSAHCTFYPPAIVRERAALAQLGVTPRLVIHPLANLTTPYDIAWNKLRQKITQHGTCAWGVGATMERQLTTPYKLFAVDTCRPEEVNRKLELIERYYLGKATQGGTQNYALYRQFVEEELTKLKTADIPKDLFQIADYEFLRGKSLVFEGAQGILLDMDHGSFPYVTYSHTTSRNALEICSKLGLEPVQYYVTRCYHTRHGAGPFLPGQVSLINAENETNKWNQWQADFRTAPLDYSLLRYALQCDADAGNQKNLVVTCCDQLPDFQLDMSQLPNYFKTIWMSYGPSANTIKPMNLLTTKTNIHEQSKVCTDTAPRQCLV